MSDPEPTRTELDPQRSDSTFSFPEADSLLTQSQLDPNATASVEPAVEARLDAHSRMEIPGYDHLEPIGEGGMGIVYKARQVRLNRVVAVKMVLGGNRVGPKELIRFLAEAEAVAAVDHPHVVRVYEFGDVEGRPFLAMEHLGGGSLGERLKTGGPLAPVDAAVLVGKLAGAVQAAHDLGIVHRDLKPGNILFDEHGEPKIVDFGLAKRGSGSDLTRTQAVMGTPAYMAPEQARGNSRLAGPAADIWALGVILYECLTRQRPFVADDIGAQLDAVMTTDPVPPRAIDSTIPRAVELICLKCLEKVPTDRYATASSLANDLNRFATGQPVSVHATGVVERTAKWMKRNPTRAAAYGLTATVVSLIAVMAMIGSLLWQARDLNVQLASEKQATEQQRDVADEARLNEEAAKKNAIQQRDVAHGARLNEEAAKKDAVAARELTAQIEYVRTIEVAHRENEDGNLVRTLQLLDTSPQQLRGWEWNYVMRLCHRDLMTFNKHTWLISSASFSPDGTRVVTASWDTTAKVWDATTGTETLTLKGHTGFVSSASFSPDGTRVVTASGDKTAKMWDAKTGTETLTLKGHTQPVRSASFSPDGMRVVTASWDTTAKVWDATTGTTALTLKGHTLPVHSASFSPDGTRVVTASDDETAKVWDAKIGTETLTLKGHTSFVSSASFSPDGTRVVTASGDKTAKVWDAKTGTTTLTLKGHTLPVSSALFSPDGTRVVTASEDKTAKMWDATTGTETLTLKGHTGWVASASFSPDGTRIVTASDDQTVKLWDAKTGIETLRLKGHTDGIKSASFSPDGTRVITASRDGTAKIWDATPVKETTPSPVAK